MCFYLVFKVEGVQISQASKFKNWLLDCVVEVYNLIF